MHPSRRVIPRVWTLCALAALAALVAGCASPKHRAPVETRGSTPAPRPTASVPAGTQAPKPASPTPSGDTEAVAPKPLPGAENAGKPGYYTVKPGDTLVRIGLDHGQNWREIVRWNNLENPNLIEVGQVLRVVPPGVDPNAATSRGVATGRVEARPLDGAKPATPALAGAPTAAAAGASAPASGAPATTAPTTAPSTAPTTAPTTAPAPPAVPAAKDDDDPAWAWPAGGAVQGSFEEGRSKGIVIAGKAGDPVLAAADGRVVYAGSGLRGYGNLVIVKHNNTYLTAYAHNQALMVKEDQVVRRGQKIAEMGSSDADRVQLHFEIRRQGKPVDPVKLLPSR